MRKAFARFKRKIPEKYSSLEYITYEPKTPEVLYQARAGVDIIVPTIQTK